MGADEEFVAFATARAKRLRDIAYLMCSDWHQAQDLTQQTLARMYLAWDRIHADNVDAYARKVMLRELLTEKRRRRSTELPVAQLPELSSRADEADLRLTLIDALRRLPRSRRAVVVLRYWDDLSVDQVAEIMRITPAAVKSLTHRAVADLRSMLGPALLTDVL